MTGLVMVEANGEDELLELRHGNRLQGVGRGGAAHAGEEALYGAGGALVLRAGGEDRAHEDAEGVVGLRLDQLDDGRGMRLELLLEQAVHLRYVCKRHVALPFRWVLFSMHPIIPYSIFRGKSDCARGGNSVYYLPLQHGTVAQLVEHDTFNVGVAGPIPASPTTPRA